MATIFGESFPLLAGAHADLLEKILVYGATGVEKIGTEVPRLGAELCQ
jgi:hypothetical protein